ncbi:hypothetical protein GCM10009868_17010 [Terrabacter aerolatus]|uniref:DUF881 domain-containing protein n=1 Tax=Terrabacter aerolatus TaxID=422442 RepID=A0A512D248_9MICO|nr:DUF881 domain-containing protein [Terrabacter aerolatus]GEO30523.1 hypothetical protein TAE01_23330 [Terrabacter aerolatus]
MAKRKKGRPAQPDVEPDATVVPGGSLPDASTSHDADADADAAYPTTPDPTPAIPPVDVADEPGPEPETPSVPDSAHAPDRAPTAPRAPVFGTGLDDGAEVDFTSSVARESGTSRVPVEGGAAWRRLLRMSRPRATRANLLGALLAVLLGAGIAAQVQLTNQRGLDELSQSDLVRLLDDVSVRSSRLDQQVRELEATRDRLKNGTGTAAEALDQAQKRVDTLGILAGTLAAKGPGITLRVTDPTKTVTGPIVLDIIEELRDAGAESIDVGGVRVVASSYVGDRGGQLVVDGVTVPRPLVIKVIGDSKTLSSAMTIPGGIVESVRQKGAEAVVTESSLIEITSVHRPVEMTHAKPVE